MQKVWERTSALGGRVRNLEDEMGPLQRDLKVVGLQTNHHANCIDDLENRLRRNSVHILALPEHMEGRNPTEFIEKWLLDLFEKQKGRTDPLLDRLPPGNLPRPFILKMLHHKVFFMFRY